MSDIKQKSHVGYNAIYSRKISSKKFTRYKVKKLLTRTDKGVIIVKLIRETH